MKQHYIYIYIYILRQTCLQSAEAKRRAKVSEFKRIDAKAYMLESMYYTARASAQDKLAAMTTRE